MRYTFTAAVVGLAVMAGSAAGQAQSAGRLNPMIALHEKGLPVFGIGHPAVSAGGGRGAAAGEAPPPQPVLGDVAQQTLAFKQGDYIFTSGANERFLQYVTELRQRGATARTYPFIAKVGIHHRDTEGSTQRIRTQLDAGHVGIMLEQVESAAEVKQGIAAMRFASQGGTRPDNNLAFAASYWGLSEAEYRQKADVWPLNPNGELIVWAIVESAAGIDNVREIAATPGLGVLWAGAGTLGGVFSTTNAEGQRVRDDAAFNAGVAKILAACKEFNVACGYPASNPADVERLMQAGWNVFVMQSFNDAGREAVLTGRRLSSRPLN